MTTVVKVLGSEIALSTANTVSNSKLVRVLETGTGNALITVKDANNNTIGTLTMIQGSEVSFVKNPTDTLASNSATVVAAPIAFSN